MNIMVSASEQRAWDAAQKIVDEAENASVIDGYMLEIVPGIVECGPGHVPDVALIPKRLCGECYLPFSVASRECVSAIVDYDNVTAALCMIAMDQAFPHVYGEGEEAISATNLFCIEDTPSPYYHARYSVVQVRWFGHEPFCRNYISERHFLDKKFLNKKLYRELDVPTFEQLIRDRDEIFHHYYGGA